MKLFRIPRLVGCIHREQLTVVDVQTRLVMLDG